MPSVRFLSLFVPDLDAARARYEAIFGVPPCEDDPDCLSPHPFAAAGPVVFELGGVKLALYQADMRGTHPGDVGIGVVTDQPLPPIAERARSAGANVFVRPAPLEGQNRELTVFMLPDRHFFEVVRSPAKEAAEGFR